MRLVLVLLLALPPSAALAHVGGVDRNGGHFDAKTGEHCHRESCFSKQEGAKPAEAEKPRRHKRPKPKPDSPPP